MDAAQRTWDEEEPEATELTITKFECDFKILS